MLTFFKLSDDIDYEQDTIEFLEAIEPYFKSNKIKKINIVINRDDNNLSLNFNDDKYLFKNFNYIIKEILSIFILNGYNFDIIILSNKQEAYNYIFVFLDIKILNLKNYLKLVFN